MLDYHVRFGMEYNPFLKNAKEILYESNEFKEVLTRLNILLTTRGFGVLTGTPGKGKTTAIRTWTKTLNPSLYKVVYSSLSTLTVVEFYRSLASNLGLEPKYRKPDNFKQIQDEITRYSVEKRITPVIVIDEANHISNATLTDLKILFNFEMDSRDRAIVLLSGLPELNYKLKLGIHEALQQRITVSYNIEGYSKEESKEYIQRKLQGVRCARQVFDDGAMDALANAAGGIPRLLNKLANASLLIASSQNLDTVNADIIGQAVLDTELS